MRYLLAALMVGVVAAPVRAGEFYLNDGQVFVNDLEGQVQFRTGGEEVTCLGDDVVYLSATRLTVDAGGQERSYDGVLVSETLKLVIDYETTMTFGADALEHYQREREFTPVAATPVWLGQHGRVMGVSGEALVVAAPDGSNRRDLVSDLRVETEFDWSSAAGRVAFAAREEGEDAPRDLWTASPNGGDLLRLTDDTATESEPTWSPDGTRIAYVTTQDEVSHLAIVPASGGEALVVSGVGAPEMLGWRRDSGALVVLDGPDDADGRLLALDGVTGEVSALYERGRVQCFACSPVDDRIALAAALSAGGEIEMLMMAEDDSVDRVGLEATPGTVLGFGGTILWSPDGTVLAVAGNATPSVSGDGFVFAQIRHEAWLVGSDGSNPRRINSGTEDWQLCAWSPDGKLLLATRGADPITLTGSVGSDSYRLSFTISGAADFAPAAAYHVEQGRWYAAGDPPADAVWLLP